MLKRIEIWLAEWEYQDRLRECEGVYADDYTHAALARAAQHLARLRGEA